MKTVMFTRVLLHISLGLWALFGPMGICATTEKGDPVVIGEKYQIESKVLKETRTYLVHTPAAYKIGKDAYPVLVLQDAEGHFAHTTAAVDMLSANGRIPAMIVVGINNTDRTRDMTPSKPTTGLGGTPWVGPAGQVPILHRGRAAADDRSQLSNPSLSSTDRPFARRFVRGLRAHEPPGGLQWLPHHESVVMVG